MSVESASKFFSNINGDKKLTSIFMDLNGKEINQEIFNDKILPVAKEMGYDFTFSELIEVCKQSRELSEDALEEVTGGRIGRGSASVLSLSSKLKSGTKHLGSDGPSLRIDIFSNGNILDVDLS